MEMTDDMKSAPTVEHCGKKCWTTTTAAGAIGVSRNTVSRWANETLDGMLDMPVFRAGRRCKAFIPVDEFVEWYYYSWQN